MKKTYRQLPIRPLPHQARDSAEACSTADAFREHIGVMPVEIWPAAGGGLLLGSAEPAFGGNAGVRRALKTLFIRIDTTGRISLIVPYVHLEAEVLCCLRIIAAAELSVPECSVSVNQGDLGDSDGRSNRRTLPSVIDMGPQAEKTLEVCSAIVREMLVCAAAGIWGIPSALCSAAEGVIRRIPDHHTTGHQIISYGDAAASAAWLQMPRTVCLRSGQWVDLPLVSRGCC